MPLSDVPLEKRSEISISNLVRGQLKFDKDSNIIIKSVQIFAKGSDEVIATAAPVLGDVSASFEVELAAKGRAGLYNSVWNVEISGKPAKIISEFKLLDELDRTLPLELQHLA